MTKGNMKIQKNKGFTLIEVVVVIVIVVILLSMLSPIVLALKKNRDKSVPKNENIESIKCPQCGYLIIQEK